MKVRPILLTALLAATSVVVGLDMASADDKRECSGTAYADDLSNLVLGTITGGKVNFLANSSDKAGCPSTSDTCKRRAFLLDTNMVVFDADTAKGSYLCASFLDARGTETDGWLPAASVKPVTATPAWIGKWKRDTSAEIHIKHTSDNKAALDGNATWGEGAATHTGDIAAALDPSQTVQGFATADDGKQVAYDKAGQYDCAVKLKQLGPYLFVTDNGNCGGANVSFTGLYRKR